ncbi:hypothetical protein [Moritella sp. 28]|uniref:hypothetical protein n=1 Tax=Moritella sp. 28 TaxID=2746232 RepID=UPI001BADCA5E|nr:hypothetical protein [Moritella sp. 28]QUM85305.1 hypothetical protein HWV02_12720 [Moritella sp. 28]
MMNKYHVSCSNCGLKISMILATKPHKCPECKEHFGFDVIGGSSDHQGVMLQGAFASGCNKYIHAEGDCHIKTDNDVVMNVNTVVTALNGASVEMNNPTIDKSPLLPSSVEFEGIKISSPKVFILRTIVRDVIGVETTISSNEDEIINFFQVVHNRIHNGLVDGLNGGALTGIRTLFSDECNGLEVIDINNNITIDGVRLLKFVAKKLIV